ncbi:group II intron maturase-specific domain-containing protein, partial [Paraburkholderia sp. EG286B]|uniref:group II intron maturase-specific domain-containing protein n=1 Tax=Paraburkholderia sp. EG286B TaxID=3237011 RepID=UPI0034D33284
MPELGTYGSGRGVSGNGHSYRDNYYGAFYRTAMHSLFSYIDLRLMRWARRKYKRLRQHKRRSAEWLRKVKSAHPW